MSAIFAWPAELSWRDRGVALTLVVPATDCNLACGFCAIRQRGEAAGASLRPEDFVAFVDGVARTRPAAMVSLQGYEPLLAEAWPYTVAILEKARSLGLPRSLVTNGILLEDRARDLAELDPTGVTVSIDSASAEHHDRLRGREGALERSLKGIRALAAVGDFRDRITISSVLMPRRRRFLEGMPDLLASLGIRHWAISPLLKMGHGRPGGAVAPTEMIIDDVLALHERAAGIGVEVVLDDELGCLESRSESYDAFLVRRFERPDGLIRLGPNGACSMGKDILRAVDEETMVWRPAEAAPSEFLAALQDHRRAASLREAA